MMWFWTRVRIMKELSEINEIINQKVIDWTGKIEELDQDKMYMIQAPGFTADQLEHFMRVLDKAKGSMNWTAPPIVVINTAVEELSQEKLEQIVKLTNEGKKRK